MDTMKDCMIPKCGDLAEMAGKRFVVGAKQLRKALQSGKAVFVYLAKNADPALTGPIEAQWSEVPKSYTNGSSIKNTWEATSATFASTKPSLCEPKSSPYPWYG